MTAEEVQQIALLAKRRGCSARALLIAAARMIDNIELTPAQMLSALYTSGSEQSRAANDAANLLLTPTSAYAIGHVDDALARLWPVSDSRVR